eukprot:5290155-Amphidinium_carterae.1
MTKGDDSKYTTLTTTLSPWPTKSTTSKTGEQVTNKTHEIQNEINEKERETYTKTAKENDRST